MDNVSWVTDFVSNPPQRGASNAILEDYHIFKFHNPGYIVTLLCRRAHMNRFVMKEHMFENSVRCAM
jgi:hypothetical protein